MIVVDTNVVLARLVELDERDVVKRLRKRADADALRATVRAWNAQHEQAVALARLEDDWRAPPFWRTECANVLVKLLRQKWLRETEAQALWPQVLELRVIEQAVPEDGLFALATRRNLSAYDARFVACAQLLGSRVVTADAGILANAPEWSWPLARASELADAPDPGQLVT